METAVKPDVVLMSPTGKRITAKAEDAADLVKYCGCTFAEPVGPQAATVADVPADVPTVGSNKATPKPKGSEENSERHSAVVSGGK